MQEKPMVSILCDTYNHEKYIAHALESFLMQKADFSFEILVHDDASTDATPDIVREYSKKYPNLIKPILQTENQYSKGINILQTIQFPRANGKYIAVCEGDDYWIDSNKLQLQVNWLENHPEDVGCVHKYIVVDENENIQNIRTFGYYDQESRYTLADFENKELPSQLASLMFRNIVNDPLTKYPEEFNDVKIQGDIKLYLYLLEYGSIYRLSQVCSAYRFVLHRGGQSWSSKNLGRIKGYQDWIELQKLEDKFRERYGRSISLQERKIIAAATTVENCFCSPSYTNLKNAITVITNQRGCISGGMRWAFHKIKKRLRCSNI